MKRVVIPSSIRILGIDADDTLWQNEEFFRLTQDRFADMLASYTPQIRCMNILWLLSSATLGAMDMA